MKISINSYEPQSLEWLNARMKFVTATEVSALFGLYKYGSVKKLVSSKIIPSEPIDNKYIRMGLMLEDGVLKAIKYDLGIEAFPIDHNKVVIYSLDDVRVSATPDGKFSHDAVSGLVECKSTSIENFRNWAIEPPISYVIQAHTQLLCTDTDICLLSCVGTTAPMPLAVYSIRRNKIIDKLIIEEVKRFWHCFDNNLVYKVNKEYKALVQQTLPETYKLLFYKSAHEY